MHIVSKNWLAIAFSAAVAMPAVAQDSGVYYTDISRYRVQACTADNHTALVEFSMAMTIDDLIENFNGRAEALDEFEQQVGLFLSNQLPSNFAAAIGHYSAAQIQTDPEVSSDTAGATIDMLDLAASGYGDNTGIYLMPIMRAAGISRDANCAAPPALLECDADYESQPLANGRYPFICTKLEP